MTDQERIADLEERLRRIRRTAEMSAGIMRDPRRTGGWDGAERVAAQFDRIAATASEYEDQRDRLYPS